MKKRQLYFVVFAALSAIIISVLASAVSAAPAANEGMLGNVLGMFGDLSKVYDKFSALIDAGIYLVIFLGLAQATIGKKFENKGGKVMVVGIALVLALGLALWERQAGFNLKSFGPIAALILLGLLGFMIWYLLKDVKIPCLGEIGKIAIIYIVIYSMFNATVPGIVWWLNTKVPIIGGLLALLFLAFFVILIIQVIRCLMEHVGGGDGGSWGSDDDNDDHNDNDNNNGGGGNTPSGPRPPGRVPPPTPPSFNPKDPSTDPDKTPSGINPKAPGPKPSAPKVPKKPKIPNKEVIYVDLSPHFDGIRSQDSLGACTAFAATSMFEYILNILKLKSKNTWLSPLFLWYKTREAMGEPLDDTGPYSCTLPMDMLFKHGVCWESLWSFEEKSTLKYQRTPDASAIMDAVNKKIVKFYSLSKDDPDQWVHELLAGNPINIGAGVPMNFGSNLDGKKLYNDYVPQSRGGHAMVIVGYHSHYPIDGKGVKCFKIRNSWSSKWGENGYIWVPAEILKKMMMEPPLVIKGWKKESFNKFTIKGRAVFDYDPRYRISEADTGKSLCLNNSVSCPGDHEFVVGVKAQIAGNIVCLGETKVKDKHAKFEISFKADASQFEKLTNLFSGADGRFFKQYLGDINFHELPPGVLVYKRAVDQEKDPAYYFHILPIKFSRGGRGGEGITNNDNPFSLLLRKGINCSGVPIGFTDKHIVEENVIIPVVRYPWEEPIFILGEEDMKLIKKVHKLAVDEKDWLASEYKYLEDLNAAFKEGNLEKALKLEIPVGRSERKADIFENRIESRLNKVKKDLPDNFRKKVDQIEMVMDTLGKSLLKITSRYGGYLKHDLIELPKAKDQKSRDAIHKKTAGEIQEAITLIRGIESEINKLLKTEEEILKSVKQ